MKKASIIFGACLLLGAAIGDSVRADDGERAAALEINRANELLRSGDADAAIDVYRRAQELAPEKADVAYNLAVAQYRKGNLVEAQQSFQAAAKNRDGALAAKARYNLGNCDYATALQAANKDPATAIQGLDRAIANYRSALDLDTTDADARTNIELAAALRDKLRQQQQQQQNQQQQNQQQQNQQQQNQQQQQDQSQQDQQQQQQQSAEQQSKDPKQQNKQQSSNNQQQQSKGEKQADQQQQSPEKSTQDQKSGKDKQQQDQAVKNEPQPSTDADQQQKQQKPSPQKQAKQPQGNEQKPSQPKMDKREDTNATNEKDAQSPQPTTPRNQQQRPSKNESNRQQEPAADPKDQQGKAAPQGALAPTSQQSDATATMHDAKAGDLDAATEDAMTRQEAEKMLQSIRDREMIRRLQRQAAERNRHVPVDRDW